jgi:hypothetical protein
MRLALLCRIPALAALAAGCASSGTYSPPEGPRAADTCPMGEVWVCRDHYPTRLETGREPPMTCMCQDMTRVP